MSVERVIERRTAERDELLARARAFLDGLDPALEVRAAAVFGSVARGGFNLWSDIDLLIVAGRLPDDSLHRLEVLGDRPPGVQPIAWTPREWRRQSARRNPIVEEVVAAGIWLRGAPEHLPGERPRHDSP